MPLINQSSIAIGDIAANPYIDWRNAKLYVSRNEIDNLELTRHVGDGVYSYSESTDTWAYRDALDTPVSLDWDGVSLGIIPETEPENAVIVKQFLYCLPEPTLTDPGMALSFLPATGQLTMNFGGTAHSITRGLLLYPGGYWESNDIADSSVVISDTDIPAEHRGRLAGVHIVYGDDNRTGELRPLTGKLAFNYGYTIAPLIS